MTPYAQEVEPGAEQTSVTEEPRTTAETTPDITTPPPTTVIGCSTSHDPRPAQSVREQETTPIRATVTAEKAADKGAVNHEKGKNELKGLSEKNNNVRFQQETDLRRSSRIRSAKRTKKMGGGEYLQFN